MPGRGDRNGGKPEEWLRIEQAVGAAFRDAAELGDGDGHHVECQGERLAMEVAGRDHLAASGQDDRIVDHRAESRPRKCWRRR